MKILLHLPILIDICHGSSSQHIGLSQVLTFELPNLKQGQYPYCDSYRPRNNYYGCNHSNRKSECT